MSNPIGLYFQNAQLSMAAYANLTVGMSGQRYKEALTANGFTDALADEFIATYSVAEDTFVDPVSGLSVTLFQKSLENGTTDKILAIRGTQKSDINDLLVDGLLSLGEGSALNPQYRALQMYYVELIQRGKISPSELITVTGHSLGGFLAQALTVDNPTSIAHTYTFNAPGTGGVPIEVLQRLGVIEDSVPSNLITNIISKNGLSVAAGLGTQVGIPVNIFIETAALNLSFHDHQIATATDALAFYDLIATIDPHADIATISSILESSATRTDLSLEAGLDALRVLFLGDCTPTPPGPSGLNDEKRETYYANLIALRNSPLTRNSYHIDSLAGMPSSVVFSQAKAGTLDGLAYRYALRELNPFVMTGFDYESVQNQDQSLSLYDATTGEGNWTMVALSDRADLLAERLLFNAIDGLEPVALNNSRRTHFLDMATNFEIGTTFPHTNDVIFGTNGNDRALEGRANDDHLYGGLGGDVISGLAGRDYLEGNAGDDEVYGGSENDILLGQQGKDFLDGGKGADRMSGGTGDDTYMVDNVGDVVTEIENGGTDEIYASTSFSLGAHIENLTLTGIADTSGTGNDLDNLIKGNSANNRLIGLRGDDLLEGSIGFDTYIYHTGDGLDRIEDSDAQGQIIFDDHLLQGGIRRAGVPANTYTSLDGRSTYVMANTDLIVNSVLIVNENFMSGQMGIQLRDVSGLPHDTGIPVGPFSDTYIGDNNDNDYVGRSAIGALAIYGNGGNDTLYGDHAPPTGSFQDLLDGGAGNDVLFGGYGDDYLIGGSGDDYAFLTEGDLFFGNDGDDYAVGIADFWDAIGPRIGSGADYADGGVGNDTMLGEMGADVLLGGDGDDVLRGENRPNGWLSLVYDNFMWNRTAQAAVVSPSGGDDYLDGGGGNDLLVGDGGNDVLIGGVGDDLLYGESDFTQTIPGEDWLEGNEGNDRMFGGAGADFLSGGDGDDLLIGDFSDDPGAADILDGGAGSDELQGGAGDDILYGGTGMDRLAGLAGNDMLDGGADNDELQGGLGDDFLWGGFGNDRATGQEGDDSLFGDEGDDELQGEVGNDTLLGGTGNDALFGQDGDDLLDGGEGDDLVVGGLGNDQLDGGTGIDDVQGREGDDVMIGGDGNDFLYGDGNNPTVLSLVGGNDTLDGEEGDDQLWGGAGQDQLFGGDGADQLVGDVGDDALFGDAGNDSLFGDSPLFVGQSGNDVLDGGEGNDVLQAGGGNDDLHGGAGTDYLIGGDGLDTYRFNLGDDVDSIQDDARQSNRLVFGAGITTDYLSLDVTTGDSLVVHVGNSGDAVEIVGFGLNSPAEFHTIGRFEFADGTVLTDAELLARGFHLSAPINGGTVIGTSFADHIQGSQAADWLEGGAGDDALIGGEGADVLEGETGDDLLDGGAGNDRLSGGAGVNLLYGGAGDDLLESSGAGDQLFGGFGDDIYRLLSGLSTVSEEANAGIDTIQLAPTASLAFQAPDHVENVQILDDFYLDSTQRVDVLGNALDNQLSGPTVLDGREGNDVLIGIGDNTFVFGHGYGQDVVRMGMQVYAQTGLDQVQLLAGVAPTDLVLENRANDLIVKISGTTDQLTVESYFAFPNNKVDQFVFADGTVWSLNDIEGRVRTFVGGEADDTFYGSLGDDTIRGLGGDDQIRASLGDDLLDGGTGADVLEGGAGNDTYVFGRDYWHDAIDEQGDSSDIDTLQLVDGITSVDVTLRATPNFGTGAILTINNTTDELNLNGFFLFDSLRVDRIQFADGTIWDYNAMLAHVEGVSLVGTEGDDYLAGNVTNDILSGTGGDDSLYGGAGNDTLLGGTGIDYLEGDAGNDTLDGGSSADSMIGGPGNDLYLVDDIGDGVTELAGQGTDMVQSSITYLLGANVENLTLSGNMLINGTGNSLSNILIGNSAANVLTGGAGNDIYVVGAGDTIVEAAGAGTDTVKTDLSWTLGANVENLILTGTTAVDGEGNSLANTLTGNSSVNILNGGTGADTLAGGLGDDIYIVDNVSDKTIELVNEGIDTVQSAVTYTLAANVENLTLTGTSAINGTGNGLDNILIGNSAANRLTGDAGNDIYIVGAGDIVVEALNAGIDTVQSSVTHTLAVNVENLTLTGIASINGTGNTLNNFLTGNSGANVLDGGTGADTMAGGAGNDTYIVDDAKDIVTETPGGGTDLVQSSISYVLESDVENLILTGSLAINGTGNALNNSLSGNTGNNILDGGSGADALAGGAGNDIYVVDNVGDTVSEAASAGADTVQSAVTFTLGANLENLTLIGSAAINGTGNTLNNILIGNSGANVLSGGTGADAMSGGAGDDTYVVDNTGDTVTENANAGLDTVQSSLTYTLGANVENLTLTGTTAINGTGNALDNILTGNSGVNVLTGGAGNDTYVVGTGDSVMENAGGGTDTIQSSITWTLGANLENLTLTGTGAINGTGNTLDNILTGNSGVNVLTGGAGNDTYVVGTGDSVVENASAGTDTVQSSITWTLGANLENLTLTGSAVINGTGNASGNTLAGNTAGNVLTGFGGNDTYLYNRGGGQDIVIDNSGTADSVLFGTTINPLDLVLSRQVNDLRISLHGSTDQVSVQSWYGGGSNQIETIQAGNGQTLLNTQVDQLIQAMANFSQQTGLTWDQAINQRPQDVQTVLAANWH